MLSLFQFVFQVFGYNLPFQKNFSECNIEKGPIKRPFQSHLGIHNYLGKPRYLIFLVGFRCAVMIWLSRNWWKGVVPTG